VYHLWICAPVWSGVAGDLWFRMVEEAFGRHGVNGLLWLPVVVLWNCSRLGCWRRRKRLFPLGWAEGSELRQT